jgi:type IV secretion system protein VirB4
LVNASDEHKIAKAIDAIFELDYSQRRLGYITQLIPDDTDSPNSLITRLSKWIGSGSLGWVIDNPVNQFDPEKFKYVGFDITSVLTPNNPVTEPLLACLFYLKDEMLARGVPTVTTVEEFWLPAMYPLTANSMVNTLKTGRKLYEYMLLILLQIQQLINKGSKMGLFKKNTDAIEPSN